MSAEKFGRQLRGQWEGKGKGKGVLMHGGQAPTTGLRTSGRHRRLGRDLRGLRLRGSKSRASTRRVTVIAAR